MENNKYIDKVIDHLVKGTKIDYENGIVSTPLFSPLLYPLGFFLSSIFFPSLLSSLSTYCRNQFGLTEEEIDYVWKEYKNIIKDKIKNGQ